MRKGAFTSANYAYQIPPALRSAPERFADRAVRLPGSFHSGAEQYPLAKPSRLFLRLRRVRPARFSADFATRASAGCAEIKSAPSSAESAVQGHFAANFGCARKRKRQRAVLRPSFVQSHLPANCGCARSRQLQSPPSNFDQLHLSANSGRADRIRAQFQPSNFDQSQFAAALGFMTIDSARSFVADDPPVKTS